MVKKKDKATQIATSLKHNYDFKFRNLVKKNQIERKDKNGERQ